MERQTQSPVSRRAAIALASILSSAGQDFGRQDKEALTIDTYPDSPYRGRIYVAWDINVADVWTARSR